METPTAAKGALYRKLPSVAELLDDPEVADLTETYSHESVAAAVRSVLEGLRSGIRDGGLDEAELGQRLGSCVCDVRATLARSLRPRLRRVVNATGVILQTNLGRAPLCDAAIEGIAQIARGYCNLEFDLQAGERSRRDVLVEDLLLRLAGLEQATPRYSAAVVNNCAAATFLALNTLAEGGEVVVSRGELVEIGGGFRVPEIMAKSGATLREVGTTNKTRLEDYARAIGPQTRLILRVHRANFEIRGFTEQPSLSELVELGRRLGVSVFEDQGTGCVVDLGAAGLPGESSWLRSVRTGASLVAASGDKLMGGPQCGILLGEQGLVDRLRANPLFRALRVDKLTYAALQATLLAYLSGREQRLPVVAMLRLSPESVQRRCLHVVTALEGSAYTAEVVPVRSVVGGGTTPGADLPSFAVALSLPSISEGELAAQLRRLEPAIVGRVCEGRVLLDLRTVQEAEDEELIALLSRRLPEKAHSAFRVAEQHSCDDRTSNDGATPG